MNKTDKLITILDEYKSQANETGNIFDSIVNIANLIDEYPDRKKDIFSALVSLETLNPLNFDTLNKILESNNIYLLFFITENLNLSNDFIEKIVDKLIDLGYEELLINLINHTPRLSDNIINKIINMDDHKYKVANQDINILIESKLVEKVAYKNDVLNTLITKIKLKKEQIDNIYLICKENKWDNEFNRYNINERYDSVIATLISQCSDPSEIVIDVLNNSSLDGIDETAFSSIVMENISEYIKSLDSEGLSRVAFNIKSLTNVSYYLILDLLFNPNTPPSFLERVISFIDNSKDSDSQSLNSIFVLLRILQNDIKLDSNQLAIIQNAVISIFKNHKSIYMPSYDGYYDLLKGFICIYDNFDVTTLKEIYKNIKNYEYKANFIKENMKSLEVDSEFLIDLLKNEGNIIRNKIARYCSNQEVLEFAALVTYPEDVDKLLSNSNINDETKLIISKLFGLYKGDSNYKVIKDFKQKFEKEHKKDEKELSLKAVDFIKKHFMLEKKEKSDTSLIQITDDIEFKDGRISIKPEHFDLIEGINPKEIKYGIYPSKYLSLLETSIMDFLYALKQLEPEKTNYTFFYDGKIHTVKVFVFNNNKYIRIKGYWIKFQPLIWTVNKDNRSLDMNMDLTALDSLHELDSLPQYELNNFLINVFKRQVFEPYVITKEEKELENNLNNEKENKLRKFKIIQKYEEDKKKKQDAKIAYDDILVQLSKLQESIDSLESKNLIDTSALLSKIRIPPETIIIKVDDHFEFNPEYIPFLKFIDLSLVSTDNLKVSGLDFSKTNLRIDPQKVYNRDLSGCTLSDDNVVFKSFKNVNLKGSNLEQETDSLDFDEAIIDENTKLPNKKNKSL